MKKLRQIRLLSILLVLVMVASTAFVFADAEPEAAGEQTPEAALEQEPAEIEVGNIADLTAEAPDGELTWESSDEAIATVDGGMVTGQAEGSAVITAYRDGEPAATWEIKVSSPIDEAVPEEAVEEETAVTEEEALPESEEVLLTKGAPAKGVAPDFHNPSVSEWKGLVGFNEYWRMCEKGTYFEFADGDETFRYYYVEQFSEYESEDYQGFYLDGDVKKDCLEYSLEINGSEENSFKPGLNEVKIHYRKGEYGLPYVTSTKYIWAVYNPYLNFSNYNYTYDGKVHRPGIELYYYDEFDNIKSISPTEYKVTWTDGKHAGYHNVKITFNDTNKYIDYVTDSYRILPIKMNVKKVKAGKRKFTAYWKKPSKAKLKNIDGFAVAYSKDYYFEKGVKYKYVSKKKASATVKKLKKGSKYYVKVYSYKNYNKRKILSFEGNQKKVKIK